MKRFEPQSKRERPAAAALVLLSALFLAITAGDAHATDSCLICHQYPGLVTIHKPDEFLILHIDPERYEKSAHGNIACEKCHRTVVRIPHTGETRVNCTDKCHQGEAEKKKVESTPLKHFHRAEQSAIRRLDDDSSCRVCHHLYPHSQNNMVRAFLNLHTGFMFCEVCHLKKENVPDTFYDWSGREVAEFIGKPYGTFYNPHLETTLKSENVITRICVYQKTEGGQRTLINTRDRGRAEKFEAEKATLPPENAAALLESFHRNINRKEVSVACDECHSKHSILDFKKLGFGDAETNNLIHMNLKGLVTKYKIFYIPHLFDN